MQHIAQIVATFSHIPGQMTGEKGSRLATRAGEDVARSSIVWIFSVINRYPGENFREGKVGRNNSTKIDNPIFGVLHGSKPNISFLKIWGCDAYVKRLQPNKLDPKADKCYFVGYAKD